MEDWALDSNFTCRIKVIEIQKLSTALEWAVSNDSKPHSVT
jgi:hypothetical protein